MGRNVLQGVLQAGIGGPGRRSLPVSASLLAVSTARLSKPSSGRSTSNVLPERSDQATAAGKQGPGARFNPRDQLTAILSGDLWLNDCGDGFNYEYGKDGKPDRRRSDQDPRLQF